MTAIVTFTTDFGMIDYYAGVVKGAILCQNPSINFIDLSHNIEAYNIVQGAYVLKNAYRSFPKKTIHIVSVNNFNDNTAFIAIRYRDYYFIGPDNGLFSLVFEEMPTEIYYLPFHESGTFPLKNIYAKAVNHILSDKPFEQIGAKALRIKERITLQPVISQSQIKGSVIHIDNYENAIINIPRVLFEQIAQNRPFELYFKRYDPITEICQNYSETEAGETLCLFNSAGYLEIAVNLGKAASLHNLKIDDTIQIDFF